MITLTGPTLTTDRLTLRLPRPSDFAAFTAFQNSPRAAARGWQMDPAAQERFWFSQFGHWVTHGFGWFVMERKTDGAPLGYVGLVQAHGRPAPEIGWTIWQADAEGQAYAHEAARAVLDHTFGTLGWDGVDAYIAPDNTRSQALAQRLGAQRGGDWTTGDGAIEQVWHLRRSA